MKEKKKNPPFRDRSALTAALVVLGVGVVALLCTVIIFSSVQCSKAVSFAKQGKTQNAVAQYEAMNGVGKALFGGKIQKSVLERYNLCLAGGNADTVMELTELMKDAFPHFDPTEYITRMEECAEAAINNGDTAGAAKMVTYMISLDPTVDLSSLQNTAEAELYKLALVEDFESADALITAVEDCDLSGFVKGLANVSYNAVFSTAELKLTNDLGEKLKTYRQISNQYNLAAYTGGEALNSFLDHYIKGCNAYGTYSELHLLCAATTSLLDSAEDYMECAFGFAGKRDVSHNYAREAYSYAVQAYNIAVKYDANQTGVADYIALCAEYIANAEAMMSWEDNSVYLSAMNKEPTLESTRDTLEANSAQDADSMENYSNTDINNALKAVFS